mgnify:CR=1 FL=1
MADLRDSGGAHPPYYIGDWDFSQKQAEETLPCPPAAAAMGGDSQVAAAAFGMIISSWTADPVERIHHYTQLNDISLSESVLPYRIHYTSDLTLY